MTCTLVFLSRHTGETRVAATPETIKKLIGKAVNLSNPETTDGKGALAKEALSAGTTQAHLTADTSVSLNGIEVKFKKGDSMDAIVSSPALIHYLPRFGVAAAMVSLLGLTGCQINNPASESLVPVLGRLLTGDVRGAALWLALTLAGMLACWAGRRRVERAGVAVGVTILQGARQRIGDHVAG